MPRVQSNVCIGEVWTRDGYLYTEINRYGLPDEKPYWVADDVIFWDYAAAAAHLTARGFLPYDTRSDGA